MKPIADAIALNEIIYKPQAKTFTLIFHANYFLSEVSVRDILRYLYQYEHLGEIVILVLQKEKTDRMKTRQHMMTDTDFKRISDVLGEINGHLIHAGEVRWRFPDIR